MVDTAPLLVGPDYRIRPLLEGDRDALYLAARDPMIWEQHPAGNRHQRNVFDPYFSALRAAGGAVVFEAKSTGRLIGCSRFYEAPDAPKEWSIGFTFIERALWGGKANFEVKRLMLNHLFQTETRVWFHIDKDNIRSQKGTAKLGAVAAGSCVADLLGTGVTSPYLSFLLTKSAWHSSAKRTAAGNDR